MGDFAGIVMFSNLRGYQTQNRNYYKFWKKAILDLMASIWNFIIYLKICDIFLQVVGFLLRNNVQRVYTSGRNRF